jgi:hypothetical protein
LLWEKRGEKGYLFLTGDEMAYDHVSKSHVQKHLDISIENDIPLKTILAEVQECWNIYFIRPRGAAWGQDAEVLSDSGKILLGENFYNLHERKGYLRTYGDNYCHERSRT